MNFIFESSSVLKNVCLLLRRITLLLNMSRISMAGWILFMPQNYYKLFQMNLFFGIWRRKNTETLVGDLISSCYYSMEVVIVRIVVISESKSDKCDLWDKQYVRIQGQWSYHGWWMLMQKVKKEMTTTPLHTSSQTRRGSLEFSDTRWEW